MEMILSFCMLHMILLSIGSRYLVNKVNCNIIHGPLSCGVTSVHLVLSSCTSAIGCKTNGSFARRRSNFNIGEQQYTDFTVAPNLKPLDLQTNGSGHVQLHLILVPHTLAPVDLLGL